MKKLRITVGNKSYDVTVEDLTEEQYPAESAAVRPSGSAPPVSQAPVAQPAAAAKPTAPVEGGSVTTPMAGAIKAILVKQGETVKQGQALVILEAMKMENQISAPSAGTVASVDVAEGDSVTEGQVLLVLG